VTALVAAGVVLAAAVGVASRPAPAPRYAGGAPPGFSGGFREQACDACHFSATVNTGPGTVVVAGLPDGYAPGERYELTVTLTRPGAALGGFQLTARFADGGGQAGTLAAGPDDGARVAVEEQGGIQYASQTKAGAAAANGAARWSLAWTAPAGGGPVRLHVAANAADGDGTAEGDFVHTATLEVPPRR
jgi:hypothetical protein